VADQDGIWEVPHRLGALRPGAGGGDTKAADVPPDQRKPSPALVGEKMLTRKGVFGIVMGHANRHLAIDPKSGGLFVGVGSSGNIGVEPEVKASIQRFDADGSNQTTYASGTRNPTALAFQPDTGDLYAVVQERDGLGDNLVPDYMIHVKQGAFYGWPYSYIGHQDLAVAPGQAVRAVQAFDVAVDPIGFGVAVIVAQQRDVADLLFGDEHIAIRQHQQAARMLESGDERRRGETVRHLRRLACIRQRHRAARRDRAGLWRRQVISLDRDAPSDLLIGQRCRTVGCGLRFRSNGGRALGLSRRSKRN